VLRVLCPYGWLNLTVHDVGAGLRPAPTGVPVRTLSWPALVCEFGGERREFLPVAVAGVGHGERLLREPVVGFQRSLLLQELDDGRRHDLVVGEERLVGAAKLRHEG